MDGRGKYFDGERPLKLPVTFELTKTDLILRHEDTLFRTWPLAELIRDPNQSEAVVLSRRSTSERLEIEEGSEKLPQFFLKGRRQAILPRHILGVLCGMLLLLLAFWLFLPSLSTALVKLIPEQREKEWAEKLRLHELGDFRPCDPSPEATGALRKLIKRIYPLTPSENTQALRFEIVKGHVQNAYTLPGGRIVVFEGLLNESSSPEELAGVLSHEIGHAQERHVLQKLIRALSSTALLNFVSGDFSILFTLDPSTILGIASLSFEREMEERADDLAFERLVLANVSPYPMGNFFERTALVDDHFSFLTTHPGDRGRIAFFRRKAKVTDIPILSDREWKELRTTYCGP